MNASEHLFTVHNSYSQQNGDMSSNSSTTSRATTESIKSVHENPFYKNFGIKHSAPTYSHRQVLRSGTAEQVEAAKQTNVNGRSPSLDDDIGEYRPGSGYVHKLLDKFSSLSAREPKVTTSYLKRSSSLDELPIENEIASVKPTVARPAGIGLEKSTHLSVARLSHRARSIESLSHSHHKPHESLSGPHSHVESKWDKERQLGAPYKLLRDSHVTITDVEIVRDETAIIEKTTSVAFMDIDGNESDDGLPKNLGSRDAIIEDELPKPNTVLTVRSIFESASSGSGLFTRRHRSESPSSPLSTKPSLPPHISVAGHDVSNWVSLQSPPAVTSPRFTNDTYAKHILPLSNLTKADNTHLYSRAELVKSPTPVISSSSGINFVRSQPATHLDDSLTSPSDVTDGKLASFERDDILKMPTVHPLASVPSALMNYRKSATGATISSSKNKQADEHPVLIFSTSDVKRKKNKSPRTKDYTLLTDTSNEFKSEDINEGKSISEQNEIQNHSDAVEKLKNELSSKVLSHKQMFDSSSKAKDRKFLDESKIMHTKRHIKIELKKTENTSLDRNMLLEEEKSKHTESTSNSPENIIINKDVSMAVHKNKTGASKRSHPNDTPAFSEEVVSKVSKDKSDSKELPVKGIPSIIAQRLKMQNSDPSQVAEDVISSYDARNFNEHPVNEESNRAVFPKENHENDSLGLEIENEIAAVRKKIEGSRSKSGGPAPIFDSSQLNRKRKEKKKQKSLESQDLVPPLDLSGVTGDGIMEYQPQQRKIPPCNIVFIGENAETSRSLLIKQRKVKINIHFNDTKTETFEYPSEEYALEVYLEDHPHEKDEILVLEEFGGGGEESSDDIEVDVFETPVTPRGNTEDDLLKANTALTHLGSLQSYRGRFQQDYELGTIHLEEPEKPVEPEPTVDPDKLMLRPAEEDDTNTYSTSSSSDILF